MLSIITPAGRTEERFIRATAESVEKLAATLGRPVQWVISSDGPEPAELEKAISPLLHLTSVTYVPPVDLPADTVGRASLARNRAFEHTIHPWLGHLDDDDMLIPDTFADLLLTAEEENYPWAAGQTRMFAEGINLPAIDFEPLTGLYEPGAFRHYATTHGFQPFLGGAGFVRRELWEEVGGWPALAYHQDAQFWLNVTDNHGGFVTSEPIYQWRRHVSQMTPVERNSRPRLWR